MENKRELITEKQREENKKQGNCLNYPFCKNIMPLKYGACKDCICDSGVKISIERRFKEL